MTGRRPLGELLGELADVANLMGGGGTVRARSLEMTLPIDMRLISTADGAELLGDVPLFITRTAFDPDPARLAVTWHAVPADGEPA
ncbi:hypothetical protein [Sphingomonas asaccharolytica]|uniref:hypothetical protein n=1 Tax=Sphingomonas asaccharolytica TaxID=40681 RepID=UPI0008377543|nr:hypothetical protein [Sphingomonas asaccharolytica]